MTDTTQPHGADLLRQWLDSTPGATGGVVARALGMTRASVSRWTLRQSVPTRQAARGLERLTSGAVPASSWPDAPLAASRPRAPHRVRPYQPPAKAPDETKPTAWL
jgi:hypothetical protein